MRRVLIDGVVVGLVTGIVGAGGGFLVVPALTLLGGLSMPVAVGTSLLVIAMKSTAGLAGYLSSVQLDWGTAAMVTLAAIAGSLVGGRLAGQVQPEHLRRGFGWFVLVMAAFILVQEIPEPIWSGLPALARLGVAAGVAAAVRGSGSSASCWAAGGVHRDRGEPRDSRGHACRACSAEVARAGTAPAGASSVAGGACRTHADEEPQSR